MLAGMYRRDMHTSMARWRLAPQGLGATGIWLAVGFSLGWYYTFTYYGRAGWPLPMPEPCAALVLYYFSVLNVATEWQALHWMLVFPLAGWLWAWALNRCAHWFGEDACALPVVYFRFSLAALPLALPGPWMAWIAGSQASGFTWERMLQVALRRGNVEPWAWLTPMYVGLGCLGLALQIWFYRRTFRMAAHRAWVHYPASSIVLVVLAGSGAALAAYPLRLWLE